MAKSLANLSEDQLFERFRTDGKPEYLAEVFDRTAPQLLRVALHLAHNPTQADDLVQSTFLKLLEQVGTYDSRRPVLPWLLGTLTNLARYAKRQDRRIVDGSRLFQPPASDPAVAAEAVEFTRAIDDAIRNLPEVYQPVLLLHLRHGLGPEEIANALGRPSGTVRSQLARGLEKLRGLLPVGFAVSFVGVLVPSRGLAAIRETVLANATEISGASIFPVVGALTMKKIIATVAVLVSLTLWMAWPDGVPAPTVLSNSGAGPAEQSISPAPSVPVISKNEDRIQRREVEPGGQDATPPGTLLVRVIWAGDGGAVGDVGVHIRPLADGDPVLRERDRRTDNSGRVLFPGIPSGTVHVRLDRAAMRSVEVLSGHQAELVFELDAGRRVHGVVVDEGGEPVPLAAIWLSKFGSTADRTWNLPDHTSTVTQADHRGRFELKGLGEQYLLSACADGYRPSAPIEIAAAGTDADSQITLRLRRDAAGILGMVTDSEGRPIPGALVRIGDDAPSFYLINPDHPTNLKLFTNQPPITVRTDSNGWYRSASAISGGDVAVYVRAADFLGRRGEVRLSRGEQTRHDVVLERGCQVYGSVISASGAPIEDAAISTDHPKRGEPSWLYAATRTGPQGLYRLTGLPPGERVLTADGGEIGSATTALTLTPETRQRWDATLGIGARIAGRVVDAHGEPIAGLTIGLRSQAAPFRKTVSDEMGAFKFADCAPTEHQVEVSDPGNPLPVPLVTEAGVSPGDPDLELVLDMAQRSAWLTGLALNPDGLPASGAKLRLVNNDVRAMADVPLDSGGRFRAGPIPIGHYGLKLLSPTHQSIDLPTVDLQGGQELDLGMRQFVAGGRIRVHVLDSLGHTPDKMRAKLRNAEGEEVRLQSILTGRFETQALPAGGYQLSVWGDGLPVTAIDVRVAVETATDVRLQLEEGYDVEFELRGVTPEVLAGKPYLLLRTSWYDGEDSLIAGLSLIYEKLDRVSFTQPFLSGDYTVRVETDTGYRGEAAFKAGPSGSGAVQVWLKK